MIISENSDLKKKYSELTPYQIPNLQPRTLTVRKRNRIPNAIIMYAYAFVELSSNYIWYHLLCMSTILFFQTHARIFFFFDILVLTAITLILEIPLFKGHVCRQSSFASCPDNCLTKHYLK